MVRQPGFPAAVSSLPAWSILFAREPEPDLDLDEMDNPDKTADPDSSPDEPEKPSGQRPLLWVLLAVVAIGGGYLAMNPDLVMDMMGQGTEAVPTPVPPPATPAKPATNPPAPSASDSPAALVTPAPSEPATASPVPSAPQAVPSAPLSTPTAPVTPPTQVTKASPAPPPPVSIPSPLFSEGQRVTVVPDAMLPAAAVSLSSDAARTRPGPMVSPSAVLTVVDGEFRGGLWVFAVRTPQGTTGWIAEKQLKAAKR